MADHNVNAQTETGPTREELYVRSLIAQSSAPSTEHVILELLETSALSNEIHPIFAHSQWEGLTDVELLRIAPALVLASRLLTCCRALHFWHALLRGPRQAVSYGNGQIRYRFDLAYYPNTPLPREEENAVLKALNSLAQKVRLSFKPQERSHGYCTMNARAWSPNDKPMLSIVVASDQLELVDLASKPWHFLLKRWLHLAVTLIHEVAHAFSVEHYGWRGEVYFGDNGYIEMGEAIIEWLVGGNPIVNSDTRVPFMELTEVGTSGRASGYRSCGTSAADLDRLPPSIHCYMVGIGYVWKLFLGKFWQEDVPLSAGMALQAPRFGCGCALCPETREDDLREWYEAQKAIVASTWSSCTGLDVMFIRR